MTGAPGGPVRPDAARTGRRGGSSGSRRLALLVVAALAGAGCCAGASGLTWWAREYHDALTGQIRMAASGSALLGELVPVALVALAGLGAMFASRGPVRRAVGVLVALGGLLVVIRACLATTTAPDGLLAAQLQRPATPAGPAELVVAGPTLAIAGGALIVLAGLLVSTGADRARRMGSAYDAPAQRRERALHHARAQQGPGPVDPGEWWRALDAGADPTAATVSAEETDIAPVAGSAPGHEGTAGTDTIGPPDGPDDATAGRPDPIDRLGHRDAPARSRQAPNEETTG